MVPCMVQLYRESRKIFPDIFDCTFNTGCQILIVFFDTGIPDLTQHQTMVFMFGTTHNNAVAVVVFRHSI